MAGYTPVTNFRVKDIYASGNPSKLIVGAELQREFEAINTSVASMTDAYNGPLVNFARKDELATGNASKTVLGAELDAEFDAINAAFSGVSAWTYTRITTFASETTVLGDKIQDELEALGTALRSLWALGRTGMYPIGGGGGNAWFLPPTIIPGIVPYSSAPGTYVVSPSAVLAPRTQAGTGVDRTPDGYEAVGGVVTLSPPARVMVSKALSSTSDTMSARVTGTDVNGNVITEDFSLGSTTRFLLGAKTFKTVTACRILASSIGADGFWCVGKVQHTPDSSSTSLVAYIYGAISIRNSDGALGAVDLLSSLGLMDENYTVDLPGSCSLLFTRAANVGTQTYLINGTETLVIPAGAVGQNTESAATYTALSSLSVSDSNSVWFDIGFKQVLY